MSKCKLKPGVSSRHCFNVPSLTKGQVRETVFGWGNELCIQWIWKPEFGFTGLWEKLHNGLSLYRRDQLFLYQFLLTVLHTVKAVKSSLNKRRGGYRKASSMCTGNSISDTEGKDSLGTPWQRDRKHTGTPQPPSGEEGLELPQINL